MKTRIFGKGMGLPVSEIVLGAAGLGTRRGYGASAEDVPRILGAYADAGGRFIDVADQYQLGEAEEQVGHFIASRREDFVICTKYTRSSLAGPAPANSGNHRKAMRQAVEGSLRRLQTDYIDIYMPHYDDGITPPEEIARGLEDLVASGKILYAGLANFPAWKAAVIAAAIPLAALQVEYNLAQRTAARELLPLARHFGLGTMLYSPLAGGLLTGKYRKGVSGRLNQAASEMFKEDAAVALILDELQQIASAFGVTPGQVALAWTLSKDCFPIIGARTPAQLQESLAALSLQLSPEQLSSLDRLSEPTLGYPHDLLKTVQTRY
jgi:aryl-alcohol dehydrogenase-like predicted oxidoreductase